MPVNQQLQNYLEQLYRKAALNTVPQLPRGTFQTPGYRAAQNYVLQNASQQAARDSTIPSRTNQTRVAGSLIRGAPGAAGANRQSSGSTAAAVGRSLGGQDWRNWLARTNPEYDTVKLGNEARGRSSVPLGPLSLAPNNSNRTGGTPNRLNIQAEMNRAAIEDRPHGQSIGQTSLDLDPDLQGPDAGTLAAIEAELRALASQEDIPGQWISPYSQEYLNQLGDRLGAAGSEAQAQFNAAVGDIVDQYGAQAQTNAGYNQALTNELQSSGSNIGINYAQSQQGQQALTDANYLAQTAAANQANDTSFMTKMGEMANLYGGNLAMQAREGLLTPKQWVGPQSGISAGESALIDFLQNKYNREMDREDALTAAALEASSGADAPGTLTQSTDENWSQVYPDVAPAIAATTDPTVRDELLRLWTASGGDPAVALQKIQTEMDADVRPTAPRLAQLPSGAVSSGYMQQVKSYQREQDEQRVQDELFKKLLEFFQKYSPTMGGQRVSLTSKNASDFKSPLG